MEQPHLWDGIFAAALGSPDPGERQLDGLGGGISSLSKVAVVRPSTRLDADVDYLFGQAAIRSVNVSYRGNCGNISAAVGPYAIDEGLVTVEGDEALVRIHNVNTNKLIHARFPLIGGQAAVEGDFTIQGVAGSGAQIRLDFIDPGGATTGKLLPVDEATSELDIPAIGRLAVSLVDAANPVLFVRADSFGLKGNETPGDINADRKLLERLDDARATAAVAMGIVETFEEAKTKVPNLPLVALLSQCEDEDADIRVRMISAGQPHKATPLTGAMCLAVAARLPGTLAAEITGPLLPDRAIRIAHASGILPVDADVRDGQAHSVTVFRTARRLMEGRVLIPSPLEPSTS